MRDIESRIKKLQDALLPPEENTVHIWTHWGNEPPPPDCPQDAVRIQTVWTTPSFAERSEDGDWREIDRLLKEE